MNDMGKNILLWLVIAVVLLTVFQNFNVSRPPEEVPYSTFLELVNGNQVRSVEVDGLIIRGERSDGISFETIQPQIVDKALIDDMVEHKVAFQGERPEQQSIWMQLLVASFPILVIIAVFMFFMRQMQGGAGGKGGLYRLVRVRPNCWEKIKLKRPLPMWQGLMKPRKKLKNWLIS